MGFRFRAWGLQFRVQDSVFRVNGLGTFLALLPQDARTCSLRSGFSSSGIALSRVVAKGILVLERTSKLDLEV